MKIKRPGLTKLPADRFVRLMSELRGIVLSNEEIHLKIKEYFDGEFTVAYNILLGAFNKPMKSIYTDDIKGANALRGDAYVAFCERVRADVRHHDADIRKASSQVKIIIDSCGNFTRRSLDGQTASVDDLFVALEKECSDAIELLELSPFLDKLRDANDEFKLLMDKRFDEKVSRKQVSIAVARKNMVEVFVITCNMIESLSILDNSEVYTKFIDKFNVILERYGPRGRVTKPTVPTTEQEKHEPEEEKPDTPEEIIEEKYPDAKEWTKMVGPDDFKNGSICFVIVEGEKIYYKMIDESNFNVNPAGGESELAWEKLE